MHLSRIAELLGPFVGGDLAEAQLAQLAAYLEILHRWNARMNLTAVRDPEQMVTRHFGESLFAARSLYPSALCPQPVPPERLIDIGSGAGFPGLPIKIWAPHLAVTLVEAHQKKATFLREVIRALDLPQISVAATRAEDLLQNFVGPGAPAGAAPDATLGHRAAGASPTAHLTITLRAVEKFERVLPIAARLASGGRLALLIGSAQVPIAQAGVPNATWSEPQPIPLSDARVLLSGTLTTYSKTATGRPGGCFGEELRANG